MHVVVSPIVNINGTSREELLNQWRRAHEALLNAETALRECTPHGRDFQTDRTGQLYNEAREQHMIRLAHLIAIRKEVEAVAINIYDQRK